MQDGDQVRADKAETRGNNRVLVGIDLGTSRTVIAASNGKRAELTSFVGKPKDVVAEKLFGKRLLFGEEAQHNRMALHLYRPLAKGVIKTDNAENIEAVRALLEHTISRVRSPNEVVYAVIGAPARASVQNKLAIVDAARGIVNGVMITSEPFSVAYGADLLTDALILDIGAGTMDLCRMHGTLPTEDDQITIDKAGDHIDQTLFDLLKKRHPEAQFSLNMIRAIKEKHGYVSDKSERIEVQLTVDGRPRKFDITEDLREACSSILPDLISAVHALIGSFDPEFQARLRNNVIVAGGGSQMYGLRKLIETGLEELGGGTVKLVDEPIFAGANGALKIAREMPEEFWEHFDSQAKRAH
ncbi:MAG: rod shape-determining protein [Polyangiaceae bacterium]|jgi:rod shape-determining protein MreB|nr:rod shape-determining protein [Polyangiaceae bacterium]